MRPRLKPVLRRVERDGRTLQFGVHPLGAVVLTGVEPPVRRLIDGLDGTRTLRQAVAGSGLDEAAAQEVVARLAAHGLIEDAAARPEPIADLPLADRDRLRPDLDRLSLTATDGGMAALSARRAARVRVYGAGRVGARVVGLLAAAGVGHICVVDPGTATAGDVVPGGIGRTETGMTREEAAVLAALRISPAVNAWPGRAASRLSDGGVRPDLVVLAPTAPLDATLVHEIVTEGVAHVLVCAFEGHGSVGPFVVPGLTPCLRCLDLTRRDRDPSWPLVGARLGGYPAGEIACDVVLSCLVAAQAAGQALAYLDEGRVPEGLLEVSPGWRWRHRRLDAHDRCGCLPGDVSGLTA
ncbi:ThiF family adenylyltransferase [Microbispora sp. H11081]|uniref:ThiF family adenylyltransferase n=1 Tax=Microbispora sp. H11081 TaxID=2729107 RepID=UPI0014752FE1|nr:ThiF family adenylyltransferase [Microbispora sp. H11081]